jgi:hypothetical protein
VLGRRERLAGQTRCRRLARSASTRPRS